MNIKSVAACSPLLLCFLCGVARADLEPFSFGASETVEHESNLNHTDDADRVSAWYSTTELRAALNQTIGRERLTSSAAVDYTGYRDLPDRNSFGYRGAVGLDWSTVGDLSGSLGADSSRHQYNYGFDEALGTSTEKNLETDNHVFAKASLGGPSRWNIFGSFDANQRKFSAQSFDVNEERQWAQSLGTTYSTSPDLSFGVTGSYTRGDYPNYVNGPANFNSKILSGTTKWQASGSSALNASLGYTSQSSDLQPTLRFVSGALNWAWTPPSHFSVNFGVSRSTDGGAAAGNVATLNDRSLNTSATLSVSYELSAKINLVANGLYAHRKYSNVGLPVIEGDGTTSTTLAVSGISNTSRISLSAHYQPTRTTDLSCGGAREVRSTGSGDLTLVTPSYTDNSVQCTASITFD